MSEIRFDGRVALVTGSGRGLGAAYARALAARGASVIVHDAGVEADGAGGDPAPADAVAAEIVAAGGVAAACHENLESESGCLATVDFATSPGKMLTEKAERLGGGSSFPLGCAFRFHGFFESAGAFQELGEISR